MTTVVSTATWDAVLRKKGTRTATWDAVLKKRRQVTWDAELYTPGGDYRGKMTTATRDALARVEPGDQITALDGGGHEEKWTGTTWIDAVRLGGAVGYESRTHKFAAKTGWYIEAGNPSYPIRLTDGGATAFSVNDVGDTSSRNLNVERYVDFTDIAVPPAMVQSKAWKATDLPLSSSRRYQTSLPIVPTYGNYIYAVITSTSTPTVHNAVYTQLMTKTANGLITHVYYTNMVSGGDDNLDLTFASNPPDAVITMFEMDGAAPVVGTSANGISTAAATPSMVSTVDCTYIIVVSSLSVTLPTYFTPPNRIAILAGTGLSHAVGLRPEPTAGLNDNGSATVANAAWNALILRIPTDTNPVGTPLVTNHGRLYVKIVGGISHLMFTGDDDVEKDLIAASGGLTDHDHTATGDGGVLTADLHDTFTVWNEQAADPAAPAADKLRLYARPRGNATGVSKMVYRDTAGAVHDVAGADYVAGPVTSDTTVSGTAVETDLVSYSIPANDLEIGATYHLWLSGTIDNIATSGTLSLRLKYGTVQLESIVLASQAGAKVDSPFWIDGYFTCRTIGATGTAHGSFYQRNAFTSSTTSVQSTATVTIDTTATTSLKFTVQWATSNAGNIFRQFMGVIERVK